MSEILETVMLISFGCSWPLNVIKSWRARTTKGKSFAFLCFILFGYAAGITGKLLNESYMASIGTKWYVLAVYILNFTMVATDFVLYFRNKRLDEKAKKAEDASSARN